MKKVNIGIIGIGRIGKLHIENVSKLPEVQIAAISDIHVDEQLVEWAARYGIRNVSTDYREVIGHPDIDAVFICSSTDTHVPLIIEAAHAGKHIFCEKPVSFSFEETKRALQAVKDAGVQLQVGFNRRFDHNFSRVREMVETGKVGETHIIKVISRDPFPPSPEYIKVSGGMFMDMTIHDFDMARYLAGSDIVEVYAKGGVFVDPIFAELGDIDTAVITLTFANGTLGMIDNSRKAAYGYDQRVEVFGSGGCVTVQNDYTNTAKLVTADGVYQDKPKLFFVERYRESYEKETKDFIDCIVNGHQVPVSGYDGLQAELAAYAAKQSLQLGRPVRLEEITELSASANRGEEDGHVKTVGA